MAVGVASRPDTTRRVEYTNLFERNRDSTAMTVANIGGAGSSKSYTLAQLMIYKLLEEHNRTIIISRKTMPALKRSSYGLIEHLLSDYGIYNLGNHNQSDHIYRYKDNEMWFMALDEPTKVKSIITGANYIWLEEANEFTEEDYRAFLLQLRKENDRPNQIFLSLNPVDEMAWIAQVLIKEPGVQVIHSTYNDNPFLDKAYRQMLLDTKERDANFYRVYVLGEWGKLENLIYSNYDIVDAMPKEYQAMAYGLDFGFVNPTALVKVQVTDRDVYLDERLYRPGMTNSQLIEFLTHEARGDLYADRDELQRIEEINQAGYNAYPGEKDVKMGIDLCKRQKLHITRDSVNIIKEIRGYQRYVDRNGTVLEEPVKYNDHCFIASTKIKTISGDKPIEDMKIGDMVLTRQGYHPVIACGLTDREADVVTAYFSDGSSLTGTPNHPFFVKGKGFIPLDTMRYGDIIEGFNPLSRITSFRTKVLCIGKQQTKKPVYNLTVDTVPEYYANGILVHNCMDAMRFGVYGLVNRFGFATAAPKKAGSQIHRFR